MLAFTEPVQLLTAADLLVVIMGLTEQRGGEETNLGYGDSGENTQSIKARSQQLCCINPPMLCRWQKHPWPVSFGLPESLFV